MATTDRDVPKNIFLPEMQFKPARRNQPRTVFYDFSRVFVEDFQYPRWWTERWGWTAFVLKLRSFRGAYGIFYPLDERIVLQRKKKSWRLSENPLARLSTLEKEIITATHLLVALTGVSIINPPPPRVFGYQKWYNSSENAMACIERSRKWFLVWFGLFSYLVAIAETKEESLRAYPQLRIAEWTKHLQDNGFQQTWIDDILSSDICSFDLETPRAGVFIKFRAGSSNQPSLDWYCDHGVPVWYELTKDSPVVPDRFSPRLHVPQTVIFEGGEPPTQPDRDDSFLNQPFTPPGISPSESYILSDPTPGNAREPELSVPVDANSDWKSFFATRDAKNAPIIAKEDQLQRQKRLSREKTPATTSAKIFEWLEDDKGIYRRQAVLGKYKLDIFEGYTKNQMRYDAIRNEWDCCVAFAPNEEAFDDDDDSDFDMYATPHDTTVKKALPHATPEGIGYSAGNGARENDSQNDSRAGSDAPEAPIDSGEVPHVTEDEIFSELLVQTPSDLKAMQRPTFPLEDATDWIPQTLPSIANTLSHNSTPEDLMEEELLQRGYFRYGFAPQGASRNVTPLREEKDKKNLMQVLGLRWYADRASALERQSLAHLSDFLGYLGRKGPVSDSDWDLGESHTNNVTLLPRFHSIRVVTVGDDGAKLFMFKNDNSSPVPWNLTMTTAAHALMVCRLDTKWDILDIARFLLGNGIPFQTLQRSDTVQRAPLSSTKPLKHPVRPFEYVFMAEDYKSYRNRCEEMLRTPRGRAALMLGGHPWRIAVTTVSLDDVLCGPSGWYTDSSKMLVATDPRTGEEYIDDQFTEDEIESLCGMNFSVTGNAYLLLT